MKQVSSESFEALPMPRKDIPQPADGRYRVYKNAKEFVTVDAGSALEALKASKVESPYRIERDNIDLIRVMEANMWDEMAAAESKPALTVENIEVPAEAAAAQSDAPLSDEDVNKLLNT